MGFWSRLFGESEKKRTKRLYKQCKQEITAWHKKRDKYKAEFGRFKGSSNEKRYEELSARKEEIGVMCTQLATSEYARKLSKRLKRMKIELNEFREMCFRV